MKKKKYKTFRELLPDIENLWDLTREQLDYLFDCVKQETYRARNFCYVICSWQTSKIITDEDRTNYLKFIVELKGVDYIKKTAYELYKSGRRGDYYIWDLEEVNPHGLSSDVALDVYRQQNPSVVYKKFLQKPKRRMRPYTIPYFSDSGKVAERSGRKRNRKLGKLEIAKSLLEYEQLEYKCFGEDQADEISLIEHLKSYKSHKSKTNE